MKLREYLNRDHMSQQVRPPTAYMDHNDPEDTADDQNMAGMMSAAAINSEEMDEEFGEGSEIGEQS
jgi:hypothetical protein